MEMKRLLRPTTGAKRGRLCALLRAIAPRAPRKLVLRRIFNPATESHSFFKANYDKLLHFLGVFTLMVWFCCFLASWEAAVFCFVACGGKTAWNYVASYLSGKKYNPVGDWIFYILGFGLWILYEVIR
jgi:hypothetical protein